MKKNFIKLTAILSLACISLGLMSFTDPKIEESRFWGSGKTTCSERSQGNGYCITYCHTPYYVMWMDVSSGPEMVGGLHACN